ncbi:uncharacterized protein [Physcomitrium patens]|uniref:uncharacterized protein isoform X2 n=1 Tax=Physcomitrium patens TaxID=3218 RepID=UPI000D15D954|nr:uncharacterized protein LOC112278313 isoform X3 [Physcomitrium patens]|eukprot:XP_024367356.1 uncharacterized protein LOC112278313 isoform X3 [Physcomitrella patens]
MPQLKGQPGSSGMNPPGGVSTINLSNWSEPPPSRRNMNPPTNNIDSDHNSADSRPSAGLCESNNDRSIHRNQQVYNFAEENDAGLKRRPGYDEKRREMYGSGIFGESCDPSEIGDTGYGGIPTEKTPGGEGQESKWRPTSDAKAKELNGSNIFGHSSYDYLPPAGRSSIQSPREHQFPRRGWTNNDYNNSPRGESQGSHYDPDDQLESAKRRSDLESAKQREINVMNEIHNDLTGSGRLNFSSAKARELAGDNIFGPPPTDAGKLPAHLREPAGKKTQLAFKHQEENPDLFAQRKHEMKSAELSGNIFYGRSNPSDEMLPQHHQRSVAKVREMSGSDIFSDDKPRARSTVGGIRKPPGGGSTIMLS